MKILMSILLFSFILCSCIKNVDKSALSIHTNDQESRDLKQHCDELESKGDVINQIQDINHLTEDLLSLLEEAKVDDDFSEILKVSDRISKLIEIIISQLDQRYITPRWNYDISWKIDRTDFNDLLGAQFKKGFKIVDAKLKSASFYGHQRDDLLKDLKMRQDGNRLYFNYIGLGSSLELCQLNRTRMFLVEVDYKNIVNRNLRRFNLISR